MAWDKDDIKRRTFYKKEMLASLTKRIDQAKTDDKKAARLSYCLCKHCYYAKGGEMAGQAFTEYKCAVCAKSTMHPNTATPMICRDCSKEHEICVSCGSELEY